MPDIYLAFQKGQRRWIECLTRFVTRSRYSHVEIFVSRGTPRPGATYTFLSSDSWSGQVRLREETLDPDIWEIVHVPWAPHDAWDRGLALLGKSYDKMALLLTHVFNFRRKTPDAYICTDVCGHALGLTNPYTYAPGELYNVISDINRVFLAQETAEARERPAPAPMRPALRPAGPPPWLASGRGRQIGADRRHVPSRARTRGAVARRIDLDAPGPASA